MRFALLASIFAFTAVPSSAETTNEISPTDPILVEQWNPKLEPPTPIITTDPIGTAPMPINIYPAVGVDGTAPAPAQTTQEAAKPEKKDTRAMDVLSGMLQGLSGMGSGGNSSTGGGSGDGMTERDSQETEGEYIDYSSNMDQAPAGYVQDGGYDSVSEFKSSVTEGNSINTSNWPANKRGLVQVPTGEEAKTDGPCGSYHYTPDQEGGKTVDNYANPTTACTFMAFLQEWKIRNPKNDIQWGDISHKTEELFNKHKSHKDGTCIDIRPMRTDNGHNGTAIGSSTYNQAKTKEMVELARSMGGKPILFNDPKTGATEWEGHNDHLHICFKPTDARVQKTCQNLKIDPKVCGNI